MQAVILVNRDKKQTAKAVMEKAVFIIGREKNHDLVLEGKEVSREHAVIRFSADGYQVENFSRNGTLLNGQMLAAPSPLKDGDVIQIGPYELRFVASSDNTIAPHADDSENEATRFVETPGLIERMKETKTEGPPPVTGDFEYVLTSTAGPIKGNKFKNWPGDLTLGRGLENNVVIPDDAISVHQAKIVHEGGDFFIEDLDSVNGTFLDGFRIKREKLAHDSKLRLGNTHFVFTMVNVAKKKKFRKITLIASSGFIVLLLLLKLVLPKDKTTELVKLADTYLEQEDYANAGKTIDLILTFNPSHEKVPELRKRTENGKKLFELNEAARAAAEAEQFDVAQQRCYEIRRLDPDNQKARELEQVISSLSEARVALDPSVRNWNEAVKLLDKVARAYPDSALVKKLIAKATSELAVYAKIETAKKNIEQLQYQAAHDILAAIPPDSTYAKEAATLLEKNDTDMTLMRVLDEATQLYQAGRTADSLAAIERGLTASSTDTKLLALKQKINNIAPLLEKMRATAPLLSSDDVDALCSAEELCKRIQTLEPDPSNILRSEAVQTAGRIRAHLQDIAKQSGADAEARRQTGDRKGALLAYQRAAKADPANPDYTRQTAELREKVTQEAQKYYKEGISLIELGMKAEALTAFEKSLNASLPGDDYNTRAAEKIRQLK